MTIVIDKQTKKGQRLEVEVTDEARTIVRVDGKLLPCVKCEGPVWADFTDQGMGCGYVVNGVTFVTEEEGLKLEEVIAATKQVIKEEKVTARATAIATAKATAIISGHVSLQYHEYHTGHPEWSVFYGGLEVRVYPSEGYRGLGREHDSEHMAGHTWLVTAAELAEVLSLSEVCVEPAYRVDPQLAGEPEGSDEIAAAAEIFARAETLYDKAQEREGVAPRPSSAKLQQLAAKYPRAAALRNLRTQLAVAQDDRLASALARAEAHLLAGGTIEDAETISKKWGY